MGRLRRRRLAALAAAIVALALDVQLVLGLMAWTLVASPLTLTVGRQAGVTLTARNLDLVSDLGCIDVVVPASFVVSGVSNLTASNGDAWAATVNGNRILVFSTSGGGRLHHAKGEQVAFVVTVTPTQAGSATWANHAHVRKDCRGADQVGTPLAITVLPIANPTRTPSPTARPTPVPTPRPTPVLTLPPLPTALPTLVVIETPAPSASGGARRTQEPSASPAPSRPPPASASPGQAGGPPAGGGTPSSGPDTFDRGPHLPGASEGVPVTVADGGFGLLGAVGTWSVPAAVVSVPGVLLLVWIGLQALGVLAWIPAVRRLRGEPSAAAKSRKG